MVVLIGGSWVSHGVLVAFGSWSHMQGFVSALASLYKPDIRAAFLDLVSCGAKHEKDRAEDANTSSSWRLWARRSLSGQWGSSSSRIPSRRSTLPSQQISETEQINNTDAYLPIQNVNNFGFDDESASRQFSLSSMGGVPSSELVVTMDEGEMSLDEEGLHATGPNLSTIVEST